MQSELLGTVDRSVIELRLGAIGAKLREVRSLIRQHRPFVLDNEPEERAARRAELLDELLYEQAQLVLRADELLDELLRRTSAS